MAVDAGDQDDAPSLPKPLHLLAGRLGGKERAVHVHVEDLWGWTDGQLQFSQTARYAARACLLERLRRVCQARLGRGQDARPGDARVHPSFPVPDRLPDLPHPLLSCK